MKPLSDHVEFIDIDMMAFQNAIAHANQEWPADYENGHINPCPRGGNVLIAKGKIPQHIDEDFAPYSYLLVLRSNDAHLTIRGGHRIPLPVGRLIRFNSHRMHGLDQARNEHFVWCCITDLEEPEPLEPMTAEAAKLLAHL